MGRSTKYMGLITKALLGLFLGLVAGLGFLFGTQAGGRFIVQKFFELEAHHLSMPCVPGEDCAHPEGRGDISRSKLGPNGPFSLAQLFIIVRHMPWGMTPPDSFPTLFSLGLDSPWADSWTKQGKSPPHTQF